MLENRGEGTIGGFRLSSEIFEKINFFLGGEVRGFIRRFDISKKSLKTEGK